MRKLALTVACGPYDRTEALRNGAVQAEGIDLTYLAIQSPPEIFARMVHKNSFHVAEMSTSLYLIRRAEGDFPYVALPIFPSRMFRHGYMWVNMKSGIKEPKDLEGKRVGIPEYRQTATVWLRGMLQHEYGVDLRTIHWYEGGVNTPREQDPVLEVRPEGELDIQYIADGETLNQKLANGEIDAFFGARRPNSFGKNPNVVRLFPNYRDVEREYFRKTGIFPMMHTLVVQEELLRENPWVAESIFKAFEEAKAWGLEQMRFSGAMRYTLPWLYHDLDEMDAVFGPDPWPYGLEPNRVALEALVQYLHEQRFLKERVSIDEMWVPIVTFNE